MVSGVRCKIRTAFKVTTYNTDGMHRSTIFMLEVLLFQKILELELELMELYLFSDLVPLAELAPQSELDPQTELDPTF